MSDLLHEGMGSEAAHVLGENEKYLIGSKGRVSRKEEMMMRVKRIQ